MRVIIRLVFWTVAQLQWIRYTLCIPFWKTSCKYLKRRLQRLASTTRATRRTMLLFNHLCVILIFALSFFVKFRVLLCLFTLFLLRRRPVRDGCLPAGRRGWGLRTFMECSRALVTSEGAIHVLSDVFSCLWRGKVRQKRTRVV